MPAPDVLWTFALASLLLALAPGPSVVLAVATGADGGVRAGAAVAAGLGVGVLPWGVLVAAGLAAVLGDHPLAARGVAAAGGCYLLRLAWTTWRGAGTVDVGDPTAVHERRPFLDGVVVNCTNPTLAPFLAGVLPPFLAVPGPPVAVQGLVLVAVLATVSAAVNAGWGIGAALAGQRLRGAGAGAVARVSALALAALGAAALLGAATGPAA